jgi:hypothetical protein
MYAAAKLLRLTGSLLVAAFALLAMVPGRAEAQTQIVHSRNEGVAACLGATATANINSAIQQKAGDDAINQVTQEGHCFNVPPDVGISVVKTIHVDGPNGGTDQVLGEVKLQNGTRSRFYMNAQDIDPNPPANPSDYADPRPAAPADFGVAPFDPSKIPPPSQ